MKKEFKKPVLKIILDTTVDSQCKNGSCQGK